MNITIIHRDSEAGVELARIMADPNTYKVNIVDRTVPDLIQGGITPAVALKQNEGMWTHSMRTEYTAQGTRVLI